MAKEDRAAALVQSSEPPIQAGDPFFNKKRGSVVPVLMDGTYHDPRFGLDLNPINK